MSAEMETLRAAAAMIREKLGEADVGVVLGSGLGDYAGQLRDARSVSYGEIPGFPVSTVPGHAGRWWSGTIRGRRVYLLQGRVHAYEGHSMQAITMYVRVMKLLGVRSLLLTNAAGCVNTAWQPGDLMMFSDFINYTGENPLAGPNLDELGPRFPDVGKACTPSLRKLCREKAEALGVTLREGVYMWFRGPSFETPAEIRMARIVGADSVGMSTVPEILVAAHCGMKVLAISCLTNMAAGILDQPLTHQEVMEVADRVRDSFTALVDAVITEMD